MDGKKISYDLKKTEESNKAEEEVKEEFIECKEEIVGDELVICGGGGKDKKNQPLAIPMEQNTLLSVEKTESVLNEPEIKQELVDYDDKLPENATLEEMAVTELLQNPEKVVEIETLIIPTPAKHVMEGETESTVDGHEAPAAVQQSGEAMLRGMDSTRKKDGQSSPERMPCCIVPEAGPSSAPEAGPTSRPPKPVSKAATKARSSAKPKARPSTKPKAGPSAALKQPPIEVLDDAVTIEYIDMLDDGAGDPGAFIRELAVVVEGAKTEVHSAPKTRKRTATQLGVAAVVEGAETEVHSKPKTRKRTVTGEHDSSLDDSILIESDDDLCVGDGTDHDPQITRSAVAEPASTTDYTNFQIQILETEDAINDSALRSIAPENAYDFSWHKEEAIFQGRQETFTGTPGPTFDMTNQTSILDVFYKMIDVEFVDMLCRETNIYARQRLDLLRSQGKLYPSSRLLRWVPTNRDEMITFLAVLILQGLYPLPEEEFYFRFNGFGTMPYFRSIMTYNRYLLLKTMMHFVNNDTANKTTKLWKIDSVIKYLNKKFAGLYYPSREIVVDESLLKWHGRLSFSQKISTKAAQVGVKTYELCESSSGYLWRFIVYAGKDKQTDQPTDDTTDQNNEGLDDIASASTRLVTESNIRPNNATALIVYQLIEPILHRGHTLIMDNFYNSPLLARCLKRQKTDVYGTLRLNREFVPDSLKTLTKTDLRQGEVVVSYCSDLSVLVWRDTNLVSMISTYHPLRVGTAPRDRLTYKPKIVLEYNKSMGGVDRKDQFLAAHPMERNRSRVWYKKLFRRLFNAAVFNSFIIYCTIDSNITHRRFRTLLAENLIKAHRQFDVRSMPLPMLTDRRTGTRCIVDNDHFPVRTGSRQTRCWLCSQRKVNSRTSWKCSECQRNLCIDICFRAYHRP